MCQSSRPENVKGGHAHLGWSDAVQDGGLNQGDDSWKRIEVEQTKDRVPALGYNSLEWVPVTVTIIKDHEKATATTAAITTL